MAATPSSWTVKELSISQPMHVGWGGDKQQKLEYLIESSSTTSGLTPTAVYLNSVHYPMPVGGPSGGQTTFLINPHGEDTGIGRKHPTLYDLGGGIKLRLSHFDARWYRNSNQAVLVTMMWKLMRDPNRWIWSREHTLMSEETRFDIDGNIIEVPGLPPPVTAYRDTALIVDRAVRQYYSLPNENQTDILNQAVNKLNNAPFSGLEPRHWRFVGAHIEPVDDWHWDFELTFHGRSEGWDTFIEPVSATGAPLGTAEVKLYEEFDFSAIPGMAYDHGGGNSGVGNPGFSQAGAMPP